MALNQRSTSKTWSRSPRQPTTSSEPASTPFRTCCTAPAAAPKPRPPADHTDGMSKWAKANPGLASKVKPGQAGYKDINKSSASSMGARAATAKPQTSTAFSKPQMMSTPKVSTSGVKAPAAAPKPAAKPSGTSRIDAATSNVGKWSEEVSALGAAYDSMYQLDELMGAVGGAGAAVGSALGIGGAAGAGAAGAIKGKDGKEKVKKAVAQGTGAAVGGALGGPVGAVIGGGVGDAVSEAYAQWQEQNDKVQGKIQPTPGV